MPEEKHVETEADVRMKDAAARKFAAEAEKAESDARLTAANAAHRELEVEVESINVRKKLREEREDLAANKHHHIYHYTSEVSESSVEACMKQLDIWRREEGVGEIEIIFTSPGGSIVSGFVLFDYIQLIMAENPDLTITTGTLGMAASMAGILLQAGKKRWMGREAWVLIHQAAFNTSGKMGAVEDTVEWVKRMQKRIVDIFARRASENDEDPAKSFKEVKKEIEKNWERKDWWLSSDECLEYGFVDEVK